ncbi:MAG: Mut7-C RNAse domain-containing protein [Acidobacteriota bacterium]|nr:Mut7-C RNAse domain-containing protein [Acidobacteriota bacterium]
MSETPRFIADVMLGRLTRWLRMLGCDVSWNSRWDDLTIASLAAREGRWILTRDHGLLARRTVRRGLLIESDRVEEQLRQVAEHFDLDFSAGPRFTRCTFCNLRLEPLERAAVRGRVPPYVLRRHTRFSTCRGCGRIFWKGSHAAHAAAHLAGGRPRGGGPDEEIESPP